MIIDKIYNDYVKVYEKEWVKYEVTLSTPPITVPMPITLEEFVLKINDETFITNWTAALSRELTLEEKKILFNI